MKFFKRSIILLSFLTAFEGSAKDKLGEDINPQQLKEALSKSTPPILIDVRTPEEYKAGTIKNAINVPLQNILKGQYTSIPCKGDKEVVLFCRSGRRSKIALNFLQSKGCRSLHNLLGGVISYGKSK